MAKSIALQARQQRLGWLWVVMPTAPMWDLGRPA